MKKFEAPEMDLIRFSVEDVIATSIGGGSGFEGSGSDEEDV